MERTLMMYLFFFTLLSVCTLAEDCSLFDQFVSDHNKEYKDDDQKEERRQIFCENMQELQNSRNRNPDCTFGINKFSDRTEEQMSEMNGFKESSEEQDDQLPPKKVGNPLSLNWVKKNVVTSVKDQGSCGSCWAFAAAACFESRQVNKKQQNISFDISEQYFVECTPDSDCDGGYTKNALDKAVKGVPLESQYSYSPWLHYDGICSEKKLVMGARTASFYRDISDDTVINFLQEDPIAVSVCSGGWSPYMSGVYSCTSDCEVNHVVLLVGYDENSWLLKNSWGEDWGDSGYIKVSRNSDGNCKVGAHVFLLWESQMSLFLALILGILGILLM